MEIKQKTLQRKVVKRVQPQEGAWTMSEIDFISDTCGFEEGSDDTGATEPETSTMNLTLNEDGSYGLLVDDD